MGIRESSIKVLLGKNSELRVFFGKPRKKAILVCVCGRYKIGWKETKY